MKNKILQFHKPELAKQDGMVYQVWEDGEVTLQKSGDLLWRRTLHCIRPGMFEPLPIDYFPCQKNNHGYIFTDERGMRDMLKLFEENVEYTSAWK